jgi:hypothetical protein
VILIGAFVYLVFAYLFLAILVIGAALLGAVGFATMLILSSVLVQRNTTVNHLDNVELQSTITGDQRPLVPAAISATLLPVAFEVWSYRERKRPPTVTCRGAYAERSANVVVAPVSVSVTGPYALVSAAAGELILQIVDQSQKTIASSPASRVLRAGLMTIAFEVNTTIRAGTTSICTNVTLQSPTAVAVSATAICHDIRAAA